MYDLGQSAGIVGLELARCRVESRALACVVPLGARRRTLESPASQLQSGIQQAEALRSSSPPF